jgi:hypothetical protein
MAMTSPAASPEYVPQSPFVPEPPQKRNRTFVVAMVVAVLVVAAAAAAITVGLTRGNDKPTSRSLSTLTPTPAVFQVLGVIRLQLGGFTWGEAGDSDLRCHGYQGFADIQPGAQVVVRDSHGATVAIGSLAQGTAENIEDSGSGFKRATTCALPFTVDGVPAGKGFYSVEVSHRGQMPYSEDAMHSPISLSLG